MGLDGIDSIAGSSVRNLWVAGKSVRAWDRPGRLVVYRWSNGSWRQARIPRERITWLPGLSVSSSGDVWIEATSPRKRDRHHLAIVLHRHGRRWASLNGINAQGTLGWPPTADGRDHVWFGTDYWNGAVLLGPGPVRSRYCGGGVYAPSLVDMHGVPGRYRTLWAAACARRLNGRMQGVILASKVW